MSVEQLNGHEPDCRVAGVLEVVDHRLVVRVLGIAGITDVVLAGGHHPVSCALAADTAVHDRPEVLAGMGMEGAALAWLQPDLPPAYVVVLEPQPCADLEIARCRVQFVPVAGAVEGALAEDGSGHLISLECDCSG